MVNARRATQFAGLAAFVAVVAAFAAGDVGRWLFRFDPVGVGGAVAASRGFFKLLVGVAGLPLLTLLFGRFFCGWLCPLGALIDGADRLFAPGLRRPGARVVKYHILLVAAVLAAYGFTAVWLIGPFNWAARLAAPSGSIGFAEAVGIVIALLIATAALGRRGFCRALCPVGALLGLAGRFAPLRLRVDDQACAHCGACWRGCRTAAFAGDPKKHDRGECVLCWECVDSCPNGALRFRFFSVADQPQPNLWRRAFLFSGAGALVAGAAAGFQAAGQAPRATLRPPGAAPGRKLGELCIRCGSCLRACPTGGLRPDPTNELWMHETPVLDGRHGGCAFACNACGQVCPTLAIRPTPLPDKQKLKLGLAVIDAAKCRPLARGETCLSCYVACPVEAIELADSAREAPWGGKVQFPVVNREKCIGCGLCEAACPVAGAGAIRTVST